MTPKESGAEVRERSAYECVQADRRKASCPDPRASSWRPEEADAEPSREPLSWLTGTRKAS